LFSAGDLPLFIPGSQGCWQLSAALSICLIEKRREKRAINLADFEKLREIAARERSLLAFDVMQKSGSAATDDAIVSAEEGGGLGGSVCED
jgi:hypothetical protein